MKPYARLAVFLITLAPLRLAAQGPAPDVIYFNGKIVTVDPRFSIAEAMAVSGGKFAAVGSNADIRKLAGPATRIVDLRVGPSYQDWRTVICTTPAAGPEWTYRTRGRLPTCWPR